MKFSLIRKCFSSQSVSSHGLCSSLLHSAYIWASSRQCLRFTAHLMFIFFRHRNQASCLFRLNWIIRDFFFLCRNNFGQVQNNHYGKIRINSLPLLVNVTAFSESNMAALNKSLPQMWTDCDSIIHSAKKEFNWRKKTKKKATKRKQCFLKPHS